MQYVADILVGGESRSFLSLDFWNPNKGFSVIVKDTAVPGVACEVTGTDVLNQDILGAGIYDSVDWYLVRHTELEAKLHTYVRCVQNYNMIPDLESEDCDIFADIAGAVGAVGTGRTKACVNTLARYMVAAGYRNSVVVQISSMNTERRILTLWQALAYYCRGCCTNLMRYEVVNFFQKTNQTRLTVKFLQSPEAQRFFTKMYLCLL